MGPATRSRIGRALLSNPQASLKFPSRNIDQNICSSVRDSLFSMGSMKSLANEGNVDACGCSIKKIDLLALTALAGDDLY